MFWKISGRTVLPEVTKGHPEEHFFQKSSGTPSSGNFPEEVVLPENFRKKGTFGCPLNIPEELSGRATSSGKFPKELLLPKVCLFFFKKKKIVLFF